MTTVDVIGAGIVATATATATVTVTVTGEVEGGTGIAMTIETA